MNFTSKKINTNAATDWLRTLIERENKKGGDQIIMMPESYEETVVQIVAPEALSTPRIVCTNEMLHKSDEDNRKIQSVKEELERIQLIPHLAF